MKRILFSILLLFSTSLWAGEKVYLSQTESLLGEPVYLVFEFSGDAEVEVIRKEISLNGLQLSYAGTESNTTIINFQVQRSKRVKFRILTSGPGEFTIPPVEILANGNKVVSPNFSLRVSSQRYNPHNFGSMFDRFFQGQQYGVPGEDDILVRFHVSKLTAYVGEPVVGYFTLYYKNIAKPLFDRNTSDSIHFPYFKSEIMGGVTVSLSETSEFNGLEYYLEPYNKEVYALTPLSPGTYQLGSTTFKVEGSPQSYFPVRTMETEPTKINVKPLPEAPLKFFEGGIGNFEAEFSWETEEIHLGEPAFAVLRVSGEGDLSSLKDPIQKYCESKACEGKYTLFDANNRKEFRELEGGRYGFYSTAEFEYGIQYPEDSRVWEPDPIEIITFNPEKESYETVRLSLKPLTILPKRPQTDTIASEGGFWKSWMTVLLGFISLSLVSGWLGYQAYNYWKSNKPPEILRRLDQITGQKRGIVLKNFFLSKGLSNETANLLSQWKTDFPGQEFEEIYSILGAGAWKHIITELNETLGVETDE